MIDGWWFSTESLLWFIFSGFQFDLCAAFCWDMEGKFLLCVSLWVLQFLCVLGGLQKEIIVPGDGKKQMD